MSDPSLNSPRRILSFSKERATVSFTDPDDKVSGFAVSEEHGPKPSEVYGFVGSISIVVATDEYCREKLNVVNSSEEEELPIEPISDIGIDQVNYLMFNSAN